MRLHPVPIGLFPRFNSPVKLFTKQSQGEILYMKTKIGCQKYLLNALLYDIKCLSFIKDVHFCNYGSQFYLLRDHFESWIIILFGEKIINLFVCLLSRDKVSFLFAWCWKLAVKSSKVKSCQPKYWVPMIWLQCALASSVCFLFFFMGHWQWIPLSMEKQWNIKLVTSNAAKKGEAKTIFKTGWHPSPDKEFFSGSVFVNTKHFSMDKTWTKVVQHQNQKKGKRKKEVVKKRKKKTKGKCIFPLLLPPKKVL